MVKTFFGGKFLRLNPQQMKIKPPPSNKNFRSLFFSFFWGMTTFGVTKCPPTFFRQNFTQDSGSQGSLQQKVHCIITYVVDCNFAIRNRSGEMDNGGERPRRLLNNGWADLLAQPLLITTSKLNDCANIVLDSYTHTQEKWRTKKKQVISYDDV